VFRKRVPGVGSGDRKSSAADGNQSDWRHDQTVSSVRFRALPVIAAARRWFRLTDTVCQYDFLLAFRSE